MGDPRRNRKKYKGPGHPWQRVRIDEERIIKREYGLVNKKEIWGAESKLRRINAQVKRLIRERARGSSQALKEEKQLLGRCYRLGFVSEGTSLEDVLNINVRNILDRRLQSIVFKSGLAMSPKQARQFVLHGHIIVDGKRVSVPSYLVSKEEEFKILFDPKSTLASEEHPERIKKMQKREAMEKARLKQEEEAAVDLTEKQLEELDKKVGGEVVAET